MARRPRSSAAAAAGRAGSRGAGARAGALAAAAPGLPLLLALLAVAGALRATGIQYGLPFGSLLNPDEQSIVPRAWKMVHGGGLDPGWFDYPTLVIYLLAPFQAWQDAPSYLTGRIVILALGLAAVVATWWLGRRAYGPWAGAVGAAGVAFATVHVDYSRMAVTDVPLTLGVAVTLGLLVLGRIEWAGVAMGLAAGAKYPGVFLAVPLVVAGWGQWRRIATGLVLAAAAFLATSPFVLVHPGQAIDDATRVQRLAADGWLGFEDDLATPLAFVDRLWDALGPLLALAVLGLAVALWRRTRADLVLASFAIVYFLDLLTLRAHFDRYTLPLLPALAVLAGRVKLAVPLAVVALAVPLWWSAGDASRLTRTDTRVVAQRWIAENIPACASVAAESSIPAMRGVSVLPLLLPGPGRPADPNRSLARLRAQGVEWVVVSGAVADRVLRARSLYPKEAALYDDLERSGTRAYRVDPGGELGGPWVTVYRLGAGGG